jgi:hypothetical protein
MRCAIATVHFDAGGCGNPLARCNSLFRLGPALRPLRKREDSGKVRDFDETKVNSYVPKTIVELFYADAVF